MEKIDLHLHTNLSDGNLSVDELIKLAIQNNCYKIAITDHDIANSFEEKEQKYNIDILSGVEINTSITNLHIVALGIDDVLKFNSELRDYRLLNEKICLEVISLLERDGYDISVYKILKFIYENKLDARIIDKRVLVKYLISKNYVSTVLEAYQKLIGKKQKYYVPSYKLSPEETIKLIDSYHGISILAHPNILNYDDKSLEKLIEYLAKVGLDGIEIKNYKMNLQYNNKYLELANRYALITTVGSDFHNPLTDKIGISVDEDVFRKVLKKIKDKHN